MPDSLLEITFEASQDVTYHERSVYTGLDFLGDIGGLFDALHSIGKAILFAISFLVRGGPINYILPRLFKREGSSR